MTAATGGMQELARLVGKWQVTGDALGTIEYRWAEGGHFMIQDVDMEYADRPIRGTEFIGHIVKPGTPPSPEIRSRFYSFLDGLTLDYIYEIEKDTLRIWFEEKSLNNFMEAQISPDNRSFFGAWRWPGGGYAFHAGRIS